MGRYFVRSEDGTSSVVEAAGVVSFEERATQYLRDRAVDILYSDGTNVSALCRGVSKTHHLGFDGRRGWWCSCRIRGECPHLIAVKSVVGTTDDEERSLALDLEAQRARERLALVLQRDPEFAVGLARAVERTAGDEGPPWLRRLVEDAPAVRIELADTMERLAAAQDQLLARELQLDAARDRVRDLERELASRGASANGDEMGLEERSQLAVRIAQAEADARRRDAENAGLHAEVTELRQRAATIATLEATIAQYARWTGELMSTLLKVRSEHRLASIERQARVEELERALASAEMRERFRREIRASVPSVSAPGRPVRLPAPGEAIRSRAWARVLDVAADDTDEPIVRSATELEP